MNVLFLTRLYWPHVGGVEKHVYEIGQKLKLKGHNLTIVTERHDPKLLEFEEHEGVKIYRIPLPDGVGESAKKWVIWKWWLGHVQLIRQADIIHIHDVFFWFLPFRFPFWHKKVYMTFHGWEGIYPIPRKNWLMHKIAEKLTQGNICVGDYIAKWYGTQPDFVTYGAT